MIKFIRKALIILFLCTINSLYAGDHFKTGDIIFHESTTNQSKAIQLATGSKYSHIGIIMKTWTGYQVLEAVQPVKMTPLETWIKEGKDGKYSVKRLKDHDKYFNSKTEAQLFKVSKKYIGKRYDPYFGWGDDRIYCSELVWKLYKEVLGIELCPLRKIRDFNLQSEAVKVKMKERYGNKIPLDEPVVAPADIHGSRYLADIKLK